MGHVWFHGLNTNTQWRHSQMNYSDKIRILYDLSSPGSELVHSNSVVVCIRE